MTTDMISNIGTPSAARPTREERREASARKDSDRQQAERVRPAGFGGPRLKLSVFGEIPGYHLYWENDEDGAVEQLLHEGFEFVEPSEVSMQSHIVADKDLANRISRFVGKKADGSPLRAYLMKIPEDLWQEREAYRYAQADERDQAIRAGAIAPDSGRYRLKNAGIALDTNFRKDY